jgi:hypothetical protein
MADGNGLPGDASPLNVHFYIELISSPGELQGLKGDHFTGLSPEVFFQCPLVDDKFSFSGFKPNPCDGGLSLTCGINGFCHFLLSSFTPTPAYRQAGSPFPLEGEDWEGGLFTLIISVQRESVFVPRVDDSGLRRSSAFEASGGPDCFWEASP